MKIKQPFILQKAQFNYNVKLHLGFTLLSSVGRGIWLGNMLSLFIVSYLETTNANGRFQPNEVLGILSGLMGFATTIVVFPAGYLADTIGRDRIIKVAAFIGILGLLIIPFTNSITIITGALILWGLFEGFSKPAIDSLIADSIVTGRRSGVYCTIHVIDHVGMALGPFLNVFLFLIFKNVWDFHSIKKVMIVGNCISFLSLLVLFLYKDRKSIGRESEALVTHAHKDRKSANRSWKSLFSLSSSNKVIPGLLLLSGIIIALGAGMTIKFLPIYFKTIYNLKPIMIQLILGATSVVTALFSIFTQRFARKKGRIEIMIIVQLIATACLFGFVFYPPLICMIVLFVIRGSFMNATQPLSNSILMDVISKKDRGKWSSVTTISWGIFWNFSAVLGGFLIGKNNFKLCFLITALIYVLGIIPLFFLLPRVHKEIKRMEKNPEELFLNEGY